MRTIDECLAKALNTIDRRFREAEWSKERAAIMRRNMAILARNRFYAENAEALGLDPTPMPLEPVPNIEVQPLTLEEVNHAHV